MDRFSRQGLTFEVDDLGDPDDRCIVLLHGFPGSRATWETVAPLLAGDGWRILVPEQRGYAPAARPRGVSAYTLAELAADVLALADAAGEQRFHLAGHDWGGAVAWYVAAHHPERLSSVAVLSTPHPRAMAESMLRSLQPLRSWYAVAFQLPGLPERLLTAAGGRSLRAALVSSELPAEVADRYVAHMLEPGALTGALNWYRAAFRHPTQLRSVGPIDVPALYVWSTRDTALGRTAAERTGRHITGSYQFTVVDDVAHWLPELEPHRVATLLSEHAGRTLAP